MLRFTDSLTGDKVDFVPREEGKASVYWCGPTVYDVPHLGHARSTLAFDLLVRYLRWTGLDVTAVSNITDIDDKIINRAADEGSSEPEVASRFEATFVEQMDRLNIAHPDLRPRATDYVDRMVEVIGELVEREMAYTTISGVYFDVDRLDEYGALVGRSVDDLREGAGARVDVDDDKADPLDFALWKSAKPGEPIWDSPWGPGRPGWHIECVAMSLHLLGDDFDIHGGGDDLVFPTTRTSEPRRWGVAGRSPATGSTTEWSRSTVRRCPSRWATSRRWPSCSMLGTRGHCAYWSSRPTTGTPWRSGRRHWTRLSRRWHDWTSLPTAWLSPIYRMPDPTSMWWTASGPPWTTT